MVLQVGGSVLCACRRALSHSLVNGHWSQAVSPLFLLLPCFILPGLPLEQRPQAPHHLLLSGVVVGVGGPAGGAERCRGKQLRRWGEAGTLDCQISTVEYLMEPGVFI